MSTRWRAIARYARIPSLAVLVLLPFVGFYLGACYERAVSAPAPRPALSGSDTPDYVLDQREIEGYLAREVGQASFGGRLFASFVTLGEDVDGDRKAHYVWAQIEEYLLEDGALKPGTAISLPVRLSLEKRGGVWVPAAFEAPRDGSYAEDIVRIFPERLREKVSLPPEAYNARAMLLTQENRLKAEASFGLGI